MLASDTRPGVGQCDRRVPQNLTTRFALRCEKALMRVLFAEDNALYRRAVSKMLTDWGYDVVVVEDGEQAWEQVQKIDSPDFIIVDWQMPKMDGIEVCRRIKESHEIGFKYVIILTGRDSDDDMVEGLSAGADDYLTKPVQSIVLKSRVAAGERILDAISTSGSGQPRVAGYEIKEQLGEGAFATVWKAVQSATSREVALKVIRVDLATDQVYLRFQREIEMMVKMDHPYIAKVYDHCTDRDQAYCAMELIDGITLDQYVLESKPKQVELLTFIARTCDALDHAHQSGVVHRDVKPSNIMVTPDLTPKLLDFGLGKSLFRDQELQAARDLSLDGSAIGTQTFMAPEQACGENDKIDGRTDIYALGIVLYILVCRRHPYDIKGKDAVRTMMAMATSQPRLPRTFVPEINDELETIMMTALARFQEDRFETAAEFGAAIRSFLGKQPASVS